MIPVIAHPKWENGQWNYHDENGDYVPVYNHTMLSLQETIDHKKEIKEALTNINYQVSDVQDQLTDFRQHANLYTEYFNEFHNGKLDIENSSIRIDDNNIQFTFDDAYTNQRYNIDRKITLSTVSNPDGSINTGLLKSAIAKEISSIVLENKVIQEDVEINNKTLNTEFAEACNPINM
jgi:regulator of replication initiation timing